MSVIEVRNLGKKYKVYNKPFDRLKEWVSSKQKHSKEFWSLRGLDFEIEKGESVGIIGQNGAGKSTLLKLLTGTILPTEGRLNVNGSVSAILELGMGFHPDFTGIQNVFMTGQLMGLSNQEIEELLPQIEEFAEIGDHMNNPIRTYSSGMTVRLGFSVITAKRPDILIVDEALAVGDAYFQHKCFNRIKEFLNEGTTLLYVSHDPAAVKSLCNRAILLDKGQQIKDGHPDEILDFYNANIAQKEADYKIRQTKGKGNKVITKSGNYKAEVKRVFFERDNKEVNAVQVHDTIELVIEVEFFEDIDAPTVGFIIKDRVGNDVYGTNTYNLNYNLGKCYKKEVKQIKFKFNADLGVGNYSITAAIHSGPTHVSQSYNWWDQAATLQIVPGTNPYFIGVNYLEIEKCKHLNI
ncbi:sugar ABC transporter ATP-binding protein [Ureibacillus massiliensis 4400831 = CIP 108448 = CCUG 49529]|uniref:Sugar ABC transporter ATP-binding protein n=1 Tax=Ureibacillus massiliensis 4400831 = CIP 108448 = CCUG 49529 TaxID=1211035 RepID=A0A0A3IZA8_9BACL|nr:ABC transporter ATP-binding protein [Ureibacillus massiliensis]KGR90046.1 sugar ABC transporter ATP-binding protein [Ureibacillus massiliensis 4400831 = CIP 108448 = CCUG 49529]